MFKKTPTEKTALDSVIDDLTAQLKEAGDGSKEDYTQMVDNLVKLNSVKDAERPDRLSYDTIATVSASLAGIIAILQHERAGIVTSKALAFVQKLR